MLKTGGRGLWAATRSYVAAAGLRRHSTVHERLEIKSEVLDFNQEWNRQNPRPFHNCFAIEILGDDAQVVKNEKRNAQNKVVSTFLPSIQVASDHLWRGPVLPCPPFGFN